MIDVVQEINAARRELGDRTLEAGEARVARITRVYDAAVEDVWDACTNPERIARWFLPVSGELALGGRYQLEGNAGGTIEACDPPRSFAATWEYGDMVTWLELRLEPDGDERTRFVLEHVAHVDDRFDQFGPGAVGVGWDLGLLGLTLHLAQGDAFDRDAVQAWTLGEDGRRFATLSAEAWGEAHAGAGADPEAARAAARRTAAFYTGAEAD